MDKKKYILGLVSDSIMDLFYYDRKDDYELGVEDIEKAVINGEVTVDEMVDVFRSRVINNVESVRYKNEQ